MRQHSNRVSRDQYDAVLFDLDLTNQRLAVPLEKQPDAAS